MVERVSLAVNRTMTGPPEWAGANGNGQKGQGEGNGAYRGNGQGKGCGDMEQRGFKGGQTRGAGMNGGRASG